MNPSKFLWASLGICCCILFTSCYNKSPEKLPKFKRKFRTQIASFESQKEKAENTVSEGVGELTSIKDALENAKNVDKEFQRVYGQWEKVDKQVEQLNKEYESLKDDANNLFGAMEAQTAGLSNTKSREELSAALKKTRTDYNATLSKTEKAIQQLRTLHAEAVDIVKALEVAFAMDQVAQIQEGLANIESRVESIMKELNSTINESKELYENKMGGDDAA